MDISAIEHPSITAENRGDFSTHMEKFDSMEAAALDGMGLKKLQGAAFKLPKDIAGMDEKARGEFMPQVHKLLNIRHAASVDELKDVNLKDGLPDGSPFDENIANMFKEFVVKENLNTSDMPKYSKFFNTLMAELKTEAATKADNDAIKAAENCDAELIKHPDIGSKENLLKMTELFKRAMESEHVGLTADEVKDLGEGLAISKMTTNPVLQRVLLKQFCPLVAEANTELDGQGKPKVGTKTDPDEGSVTYKALGWSK